MTSLINRIAVMAIPLLGTNKLIPRALAAGKAPSQNPSRRIAARHRITSEIFEGRDIWHILPKKAVTSSKVIVHFHGGGFVVGMPRAFYPALGRLADLTGCRLIAPDYPLPPVSCGEDVRAWSAAYYKTVCDAYGVDNTILTGDSAGANLALWLAQRQSRPAHLMLWSPWTDLTHSDPAQDAINTEPLIDIPTIRAAAARYAGDTPLGHSDISPIFGDHSGLPPVTIYSGTYDLFHGDIERLYKVMKSDGADVTLQSAPGCTHDYMYLPTPEAKAALAHMADIIRAI